jgi:basic amino acid/polyamine antiporter, APA family
MTQEIQSAHVEAGPKRHVSTPYLVMVAVAMVVGAGIFKSPAYVASGTGSLEWMAVAWILGGALTLIAALCYAEMSTAFPNAGGDYHFLKLAYGRQIAFLFAWARFAVINTGSMAMLGFVLGDYANAAYSLGTNGPAIYALTAILVLTVFNLRSLYSGANADYSLTGLEVTGLLIMFSAGLWLTIQGAPALTVDPPIKTPPDFGLAMVFVLLAFGGWSEIATMSSEVKDRRRGMLRALVLSVAVITMLYLMVNWAFWRGLGIQGLADSAVPAADLIRAAYGENTAFLIAVAIAIATITSINATIVVGARTTYAATHDFPALKAVGQWDNTRGIPTRAILFQSAIAVVLVGMGAASRDGFSTLVDYSAPVFWFFMALSAVAVLILRSKYPAVERPYRAPLYPLTPLLFLASALFMLWSSANYAIYVVGPQRVGVIAGIAVLVLGVVLMLILKPAQDADAPATR